MYWAPGKMYGFAHVFLCRFIMVWEGALRLRGLYNFEQLANKDIMLCDTS